MGTCTRTSRQAYNAAYFGVFPCPAPPLNGMARNGIAQCSLYIDSHHPVRLESLALKRVSHLARFEVELTGSFDLKGYNELDADDIPLALHGVLDFEGVVVPNNLWPKPTDPDQAVRALAPFLNQSNVSAPEWDRFRYVFKGVA